MIRRIKRIKPKKRFTPVQVIDPVKTGDERDFIFLPPLEPKKRMLVISSAVFAVWVVGLIVMYATTVYPQRHGKLQPSTQPVPATQAVPATPTSMPINA